MAEPPIWTTGLRVVPYSRAVKDPLHRDYSSKRREKDLDSW